MRSVQNFSSLRAAWLVTLLPIFTMLTVDCAAPTAIEIAFRADPDLCAAAADAATTRLLVTVGRPAEVESQAPTRTFSIGCDPSGSQRLQTLVLTPSDDKEASVSVRAVVATGQASAEECAARAFSDCVVSRRTVRFVPNRTVRLSMDLERSCVGANDRCSQVLPDGQNVGTCVDGVCRSALVNADQCIDTRCTGAELPRKDQPDATATLDTGTDTGADTGVDAAPPQAPLSCKTILAAAPSSASGMYSIDPDGAGGPLGDFSVFCDMTFDGGGWTLVFSNTANRSLADPGDEGTNAAGDAAYYVNVPAPGTLGAFKGEVVAALAASSDRVHIRTPFAADAGSGDGGAYITSTLLADGGLTLPMTNLRALKRLNVGGDGGFAADWTGPNATAARLSYVSTDASCNQVDPYPALYTACRNTEGLFLFKSAARWIYVEGGAPNENMEVYVR